MNRAMPDMPEPPLKWLLNELPQYLDGEELDQIQSDFEIVKRRYDLTSRLRLAKQELALFRRNQSAHLPGSARYQSYGVKVERRLERIKTLEQKISEL